MTTTRKSLFFSRPASILLMICFFMPWTVSVSCRDVEVTRNGWQFIIGLFSRMQTETRCEYITSTGLELATGIQNQKQIQGTSLYFIIPIMAIIILVVSFFPLKIARIVYFVSAITGLIFIFYVYFQNGLASIKIGWLLSLIALLATLLAGYFTRNDELKLAIKKQEILEHNKQKAAPKS